MLLKIIGSVMVISASSLLGYIFSRNCSRRPQELRDLQALLQMLENEISFLSNLLADSFDRINRSSTSPVSELFKHTVILLRSNTGFNACQAWERSVMENIKNTALKKEDEEILLTFGKMLGNSDLEGQIKNIRMTISQLKLQEMKAEESRKKNEALYRNLGILGGIAIVIILI